MQTAVSLIRCHKEPQRGSFRHDNQSEKGGSRCHGKHTGESTLHASMGN